MTENTVKQLAFTAASAVSPLVQNWTNELHAMNDNEEPDPPPAISARMPWIAPFTSVAPQILDAAA